jgi:hypothetical protein
MKWKTNPLRLELICLGGEAATRSFVEGRESG